MDWGALLFSFRGRINRAKYWLAILVYFVAGLVLGIIGFLLGKGGGYQALSFVFEVVVFISGLAVGAKRLHDRDKSAWWLLLFNVAPTLLVAVGIGVALGSGSWTALLVCGVLAIAIAVWAFIEFGCLRGTVGDNAYGPDPLAARP